MFRREPVLPALRDLLVCRPVSLWTWLVFGWSLLQQATACWAYPVSCVSILWETPYCAGVTMRKLESRMRQLVDHPEGYCWTRKCSARVIGKVVVVV